MLWILKQLEMFPGNFRYYAYSPHLFWRLKFLTQNSVLPLALVVKTDGSIRPISSAVRRIFFCFAKANRGKKEKKKISQCYYIEL